MRGRVYYGWIVVGGLFLILTVSSGFGFYNLSLYMNVLAVKTGFSISELSLAVSLFFVVGGVGGIWAAALFERFDMRLVMGAGALLAGLSLALMGRASELWHIYALHVAFGIGNSAVSIVTNATLVARWFPGANRSVALSFASTGLSMGGVVLTPLSARLLNELGLEVVMPWMGAAFFLLMLPVVILIIRPHPDGASARDPGRDPGEGWTYRAAVRSRFFALVTLAYVICMGSQVGGIAHLYNRVDGLAGYAVAAMAVQALTVMSILCRILGGFFVSRISIRTFSLGNLLLQASGLTLIGMATTPAGVLAGAGLFGASVGNLLMSHPLWLAEAFGVRAYARIFALSNAITVVGVAGGPLVLGLMYDFQDYGIAYGAAAVMSVLAWLIMFAAGTMPPATHAPGDGLTARRDD